MRTSKYRIAFLVSHPIQYFSPLFRLISLHPAFDLTVYYCSDEGFREMKDVEFGTKIKWDIPLLDGYYSKILKNYSLISSTHRKPFGLINTGIICEIVRKKYDACIVHGWNYVTAWLAFAVATLTRTPFIIRAESPLNQELLKSKWKIVTKKIVLGLFFKYVDGFLAIGTQSKEFYEFYGAPKSKIFFVPYAIDNDRYTKVYDEFIHHKKRIKEEIGIHPDKIVISFVGKLIDVKRPLDLIKAFEKAALTNAVLIFIGEGNLRKILEDYVCINKIERVVFMGFKNQSELPKYYIVADIFVLPSSSETWGLVVNEAMCFHLPVVVSNIVGCSTDLVISGENGYIYETGNIVQLSEYLQRLANDGQLRKNMGEKSFDIIKRWNYQKDVEELLRALEMILNG